MVNTHYPVLLKCLTNDSYDTEDGVSIWFSRMDSRRVEFEGRYSNLKVSRITPLSKSFQYSFSTEENKMTVADAMDYLTFEYDR